MKFEYTEPIRGFCGLAAKSYAVKFNDHTDRRAKGVKRKWAKTHLDFDDYVDVLNGQQPKKARYQLFRSRKMKITTDEVSKISLPTSDDKRVFIDNSFETVPIGYY